MEARAEGVHGLADVGAVHLVLLRVQVVLLVETVKYSIHTVQRSVRTNIDRKL